MFKRKESGDLKVSLKAMRVHRNLRQAQVAETMGISVDRLKYLESEEGSRNMTYENLLRFCSLYECTVDDIFLPINYPESEVKSEVYE